MPSIIGITIEQTRAAEFGSALSSEGWPRDAWPTTASACGSEGGATMRERPSDDEMERLRAATADALAELRKVRDAFSLRPTLRRSVRVEMAKKRAADARAAEWKAQMAAVAS